MDHTNQLKWALLTQINGRPEADLLQSYLQAHGLEVELIQEAAGHNVYPVTIDGLGRVQLFVSKTQEADARKWLNEYNRAREGK